MNKKIKVIYIANLPLFDGSSIALLNILSSIKSYIEILVIFPGDGPLSETIKSLGIDIKFVKYRMAIYPSINSFKDFILFIPRIVKVILINKSATKSIIAITNSFNPDLIHTNIGPIHVGHAVAKKVNVPHIWHLREYQDLFFGWTPFPSMSRYISKLNNKNNNIIAISRGIVEHYKIANNALVINDGVFDANNLPPINPIKKKNFLFVGRLEEGKGIKDIILAFIAFAKNNSEYELEIAGIGEELYTNQLQKLVDDSEFSHRIKFLGYRSDVYELMSDSKALIVSSRFEGFGFITAEAMFNGCLVIGNNTAGTKEQFDNGLHRHGKEIGIRYSGHNDLVLSLQSVSKNEIIYYLPMIERAQETAANLYSNQQNINKILEYYKKTIINQK